MTAVTRAYLFLFPEGVEESQWRRAEEVLNHFDVVGLGERLALLVLCEIIIHVKFPSREVQEKLVLRAEGLIDEILDIPSYHETNMDEIQNVEQMLLLEEKSIKEIKASFGRRRIY